MLYRLFATEKRKITREIRSLLSSSFLPTQDIILFGKVNIGINSAFALRHDCMRRVNHASFVQAEPDFSRCSTISGYNHRLIPKMREYHQSQRVAHLK